MSFNGYDGNFVPSVPVTIAVGAQESSAVPTKGFLLSGMIMPPVLTGTAISFMIGDSEDGFQAQGQIYFSGVTSDGDTIEINGVVITFVDADPTGDEVLIGGDAEETADNLFEFLSSTEDEDLLACSYVQSGDVIMVTFIEHGADGNAITFDKSSSDITLAPAGGTLSGGGFRDLYNPSNTIISMTVAAGRAYAIDQTYFKGIEYLKIKSGSVELAPRTVLLSLRG